LLAGERAVRVAQVSQMNALTLPFLALWRTTWRRMAFGVAWGSNKAMAASRWSISQVTLWTSASRLSR
jgi:hypothetical protein